MRTRIYVYATCAVALFVTSITLGVFTEHDDLSMLVTIIGLLFFSAETYWQGRINGSKLTVKDREAVADAGYAEGWNDAIEEMKRRRGLR